MNYSASKYNVQVSYLRAVSIIAVLFYHLDFSWSAYGYLGVDIFFVISGFLMAKIYPSLLNKAEIVEFYKRRALRIFPAYYVIILICAIFSAVIVIPHQQQVVLRSIIFSMFFAENIDAWMTSGYFADHLFRPLLHLWSIGVEIQFYLFVPIIALLCRRSKNAFVVVILLSFTAFVVMQTVSTKTGFLLSPLRLWQFGIGYLIGMGRVVPGRTAFAISVFLLIVLIFLFKFFEASNLIAATLITIAAAFAIYKSGSANRPAGVFLWVVDQVGKYSFALYLVHFPIIRFIGYIPFEGNVSNFDDFRGLAVVLLAIFAGTLALYHLVELPFRTWRGNWRSMAQIGAFAAVSIVLAALVAPMVFGPGLNDRERLASEAWNDRLPERCPKIDRLLRPFDRSCLIAGNGGAVTLLLGDSHADVLKAVLGQEIVKDGGSLRLLINHSGVYFSNSRQVAVEAKRQKIDSISMNVLTPADVIDEAEAVGATNIFFHARAQHFDVDALSSLADMARARSITMYILLPVPNADFDIPQKLFMTARGNGEILNVIPRVTNELDLKSRHRLEFMSKNNEFLRILDPWPFFCDPRCKMASSDGIPYFSDSQHLTQTGVDLIRPIFATMGNEE